MYTEGRRNQGIFRTIAVLAVWISATAAPLYSQDDAYTVGDSGSLFTSEQPGDAGAASTRDEPRRRWIVRGDVLALISTGDEAGVLTPVPDSFGSEKSVSSGVGLGIGLEYLVRRKLGVEFTVLFGDFDSDLTVDTGELRATDGQDIGFTAATLGVDYHLTPDARADLYIGVFAEFSFYDDVTYQFPEIGLSVKRSFDDDLGFGFKAGVDVPIKAGSRWVVAAQAQHLRGPLDIKPVIVSIGIGYRF